MPTDPKAIAAVAKALADGTLVRPLTCSKCSRVTKLDAHHENYNKPLKIRWLCVACHRERHAQLRRMGRRIPGELSVMRVSWKISRHVVLRVKRAADERRVWPEKLVAELLTEGLKEDC